jgi:hypothetical protein
MSQALDEVFFSQLKPQRVISGTDTYYIAFPGPRQITFGALLLRNPPAAPQGASTSLLAPRAAG